MLTPCSRRRAHTRCMGDFLVIVGTLVFFGAMLGLVWALDRV
jgi:hypothetical protein